MKSRSSGQDKGNQYVELLASYLADLKKSGGDLPRLPSGKLNLTKIAIESGVKDRGRFYTNGRLADQLKEFSAPPPPAPEIFHGDSPPPVLSPDSDEPLGQQALRRAERRIHQLEQSNAALTAENAELRRELREVRLQLGREDMQIETGRRIPSTSVLESASTWMRDRRAVTGFDEE